VFAAPVMVEPRHQQRVQLRALAQQRVAHRAGAGKHAEATFFGTIQAQQASEHGAVGVKAQGGIAVVPTYVLAIGQPHVLHISLHGA
jgi:hypothetical protein